MVLDHCFSTWGSRSPEPFRCVLKGSSLQDFHFMVSSQLALQHVLPSCISHVHLFVTPWTIAHQAPLSMGSSRQEYWSGLPCPLPGDLPDPGIEPTTVTSPALAGEFFTSSTTWEAPWVLSHSVVSESLQPHRLPLPGSSVDGDSPGRNTRVGCHALLQGIFSTQEWNPGLPHCRLTLYHLSHQGNTGKPQFPT